MFPIMLFLLYGKFIIHHIPLYLPYSEKYPQLQNILCVALPFVFLLSIYIFNKHYLEVFSLLNYLEMITLVYHLSFLKLSKGEGAVGDA